MISTYSNFLLYIIINTIEVPCFSFKNKSPHSTLLCHTSLLNSWGQLNKNLPLTAANARASKKKRWHQQSICSVDRSLSLILFFLSLAFAPSLLRSANSIICAKDNRKPQCLIMITTLQLARRDAIDNQYRGRVGYQEHTRPWNSECVTLLASWRSCCYCIYVCLFFEGGCPAK